MKKKNLIKYSVGVLTVIAIMGCGMIVGMLLPVQAAPQVIVQTVIQEVPVVQTVNVPVYVDREVVKEVPVDVVKEVIVEKIVIKNIEVPVFLKDFQSLGELTVWVSGHSIFGIAGICVPMAQEYAQMAAKDGYYLSLQTVENGRIFGVKVTDSLIPHMGCMAVIEKQIYYIEPATRQITLFGKGT